MTSDDKTNPRPKLGLLRKKMRLPRKTRARRRTRRRQTQTYLRLRAARKLPTRPPVIVGARAKNRFRKLIRITGTRSTRKKKRRSDSWINGTGMAVCRAAGYSCQGVCSRRGLQGRSCSRRRIESGKEAVEPKGWLTGLIPERAGQAAVSCLRHRHWRTPGRSTSDSYQPDFALARASDGALIVCVDKSQTWRRHSGSSYHRTWLRSRG
jgi:hypothetical protein